MSRDFIADVIGRAVHEEPFRRLLQHNAETAADAMGIEYDAGDLRILNGIKSTIEDLDADSAREYLQEIAAQPQNIPGNPLRPRE